jgi:hypothetical protein
MLRIDEHPVFLSVVRSILNKVIGPHMITVLRSQPKAGAVCEPQAPAFRLSVRNLQPLTPPDAFDPLIVHEPARMAQQRGDLAIAVAAIPAGKLNDVGGQTFFVVSPRRRLPLRRAMLAERHTSAALGDVKLTSNMLNALASACGA